MPASLVVLVDVPEPYLGGFLEHARGEEFAVAAVTELAAVSGTASLAVVGVRGESHASPERIRTIRKAIGQAPVVVLAHGIGVDSVVALMRAGVADVIGLPAPSADVVARALLRAADQGSDELVGRSHTMQRLRAEVAAIAPIRSTLLITGETGVGKGVLARLVHRSSGRADRPFVHVDCSALAPSIIESELFGHERGAFTGAIGSRAGRFELAGDGTIFLDEIGELDTSIQAKLLRVLQDRGYERIGGTTTRVMAARVIAATNRDLRAAVAKGEFRTDLLFRLNVFHLSIPPLRERVCDIPELARLGVEKISERLQIDPPVLDDSFYERLCSYPWHGNVRELMNFLESALVRHQAGISPGILSSSSFGSIWPEREPGEPPGEEAWEEDGGGDERSHLEEVLRSVGGNVSRAARRLGVPRSTLRYKIRVNRLSHLLLRD